jgi:hypothetical protein
MVLAVEIRGAAQQRADGNLPFGARQRGAKGRSACRGLRRDVPCNLAIPSHRGSRFGRPSGNRRLAAGDSMIARQGSMRLELG